MDYQVLWLHNSIILTGNGLGEDQGRAIIMEHYAV